MCSGSQNILFSDEETKYFDSLNTFGDNQDYIKKLHQDIGNLRREYAEKTRMSPNILDKRIERPDTKARSTKDSVDLDHLRGERRSEATLVKRSFWEDLARVKEKMIRTGGERSEVEAGVRDSWYRTSRRFSDSR